MDFQVIAQQKNWTLFLDRDGVLNERLPDAYVTHPSKLTILPGIPEALTHLNQLFQYTIVVTNQQGVGKGLMSERDLAKVHKRMTEELGKGGAHIDKIYFCPGLTKDNPICRKPNTGMAMEAKKDFPDIHFSKSIMVGDSFTDLEFGRRMGMKTVYIPSGKEKSNPPSELADVICHSLAGLVELFLYS